MSESIEIRIQPLVLIADDDASARAVMRNVLEQSGFDVVEAADGKEAVQVYESAVPDVVLTDIGMPNCDGLSVTEAIRQKETCRKTPICVVTELADDNAVDRAYEAGATDFIGNPISWAALPHRLRYLLRTSEALNDVRSLLVALPDSVFVLDEHGLQGGCVLGPQGTSGDQGHEDQQDTDDRADRSTHDGSFRARHASVGR